MSNIQVIPVSNTEHYDILAGLLCDYVKELHDIDNTVQIRTVDKLKSEYFYDGDTLFYLMFYNEKPVGFSVLGVNSNCHPLADIYINEFYICPDYRCEGLGKVLFDSCLEYNNYVDRICFFVLSNNHNAVSFWENLLSADWVDVTERYACDHKDNLIWYMFERRF